MGRTGEVARYFLRLGVVGFGGPPAHIAAMHDDLVRKRGWIDEERFLEVAGVTNLVPGPNSTEVAIHLGYLRSGPLGGVAAGLAFMVPAFLMVLALSWIYFEAGTFRLRDDLLAGIQAVAVAAILAGTWRLRAGILGGWMKPVLAAAAFGLTLAFPALTPLVILGAGTAALLAEVGADRVGAWLIPPVAVTAGGGLGGLALVFLRTGLLLFGGGLALVPLLAPVVEARGWLTESQFLDGIALGQATPGPVLMTAAFVGFAVEGWLGSVVATAAVFLPSFFVVLVVTGPFLRRFREHPGVAAFVRGVTAGALGAVLAAAVDLGRVGLAGPVRVVIFAGALVAILARLPVAWVVLAGAVLGAAAGAVGLA